MPDEPGIPGTDRRVARSHADPALYPNARLDSRVTPENDVREVPEMTVDAPGHAIPYHSSFVQPSAASASFTLSEIRFSFQCSSASIKRFRSISMPTFSLALIWSASG